MLLLDDNTPSLMTAAAQGAAAPTIPDDKFGQTLKVTDSITHTVADSLKNMNLSDIKSIVTGENTIVKDGLRELTQLTVGFIPKLLVAVLILWVGMKLAKMLKRAIIRALDRRGAEASLKSFLASLVDLLLKAMIIIMAMDVIGIKATSFIALLGAMGLAIGMALQGTLQNFAGGVIILLMKPFKVDDYIECGNYKGYIKEIRIFHTFMRPFNGRTIIIPNSELATKSLINHTKEPVIRLDVVASVAYGTDLKKAKEALWQVINNEPLILHEPKAPTIAVSNLGDSSVDLTLWLWVTVEDYWTLWMHIREDIYIAFNNAGVEIPFPQITLHHGAEKQPIQMEPRTATAHLQTSEEEKLGAGD
ncbi:MAG: small-conductance mechanosensitive channel [bacterium P3]|nr:MAG: small-conductance mechanosensitive channel [bacterium P3]KWW39002.1 MAG: small-conductance mechanosensitive channel [bacterium F083]